MQQHKIKIRFQISQMYDIHGYFMMKNSWMNSTNFYTSIFSKFPKNERPQIKINSSSKQNEQTLIRDFTRNNYKTNRPIILQKMKRIENVWKKKNENFFKLSNKIFGDSKILHTTYTAFPSIWPMYLRDTNSKQISFPYNKGIEHAIFVLSHEILHILFYDYLYRKFRKLRPLLTTEAVWSFSEVFNVLIQNEKKWFQLTGLRARPYPQHKELYKKMSVVWKKNHNIDDLVTKFLGE